MNQDLLDDEEEIDGNPLPVAPKQVPTHIKVLACGMLFVVGIAAGSTGHSMYTYKTPPTPEGLEVLSKMVSRMNLSASPCSALYSYSCGRYEKQHFPFSGASTFGELVEEASTAAYNAFDAYAEQNPTDPASIFYRKCQDAGEQDAHDCTIVAKAGAPLIKALWEHGYGIEKLYVDRTASPYLQNTRSFAIFLESYTPGSLKRPLQITASTDPCNLFDVLRLVYACSECEDGTILLYGDSDAICENWQRIEENRTSASLVAQNEAKASCLDTMPFGRSLGTCVSHTSTFYTAVSRAYTATPGGSDEQVAQLFAVIQNTLAAIVRPLGDKVADKVASVVLHSDWNPHNQEPGPSTQTLMRNQTYAQLFLRSMQTKAQHSLQDRKFISPLWGMQAYAINAYYQPSENSVYIPNAMRVLLKGVEFSASLAFILAHELAHSIDPSSINYNKDGQYDDSMLTEEGTRFYDRFLGCIRTNRDKQLSEDFADRVSSQVVSRIAPESSTVAEFDTFVLTAAQMNVLHMAQLWCSAKTHEKYEDSHSPARLRVEESMSGLFTHEFGCVQQQTCIIG